MFSRKKTKTKSTLNWKPLTNVDQLDSIVQESNSQPVLVFKHSTRCSISATALNRIERSWDEKAENISAYYLDLISYRDISNTIASKFGVIHQSPQAILLKDGKVVYDGSHFDISYDNIINNSVT